MVHGTNTTGHANERSGHSISEPDTQPRLPPRETDGQGGSGDHEGIDVDRVGDPEEDVVAASPYSAGGLDRLEIMVDEEELSTAEAFFVRGLLFDDIMVSFKIPSKAVDW